METKEIKGAFIVDKSIKEKSDGTPYAVFSVKINTGDKYPKNFSWFYTKEDDADATAEAKAVIEQVKKNSYADITFYETGGEYNGKPVTYRNVVNIVPGEKSVSLMDYRSAIDNSKDTESVVASVGKIANTVKEVWIENFLNDERLKDIPHSEMVSIFSTMFIQSCRQLE